MVCDWNPQGSPFDSIRPKRRVPYWNLVPRSSLQTLMFAATSSSLECRGRHSGKRLRSTQCLSILRFSISLDLNLYLFLYQPSYSIKHSRLRGLPRSLFLLLDPRRMGMRSLAMNEWRCDRFVRYDQTPSEETRISVRELAQSSWSQAR